MTVYAYASGRLRAEFDDTTRSHFPPQERTSLSPFVKQFRDSFLSSLDKTCVEELKCKIHCMSNTSC